MDRDPDQPHLYSVPTGPELEQERRRPPKLDRLGFDPRLMTPARLLALAGGSHQIVDGGVLRCCACGGAVTTLVDGRGHPYEVTGTQMLMNTLRHLVVAHDLSLSGKEKEESEPEGGVECEEITAITAAKKKRRWFRRH